MSCRFIIFYNYFLSFCKHFCTVHFLIRNNLLSASLCKLPELNFKTGRKLFTRNVKNRPYLLEETVFSNNRIIITCLWAHLGPTMLWVDQEVEPLLLPNKDARRYCFQSRLPVILSTKEDGIKLPPLCTGTSLPMFKLFTMKHVWSASG